MTPNIELTSAAQSRSGQRQRGVRLSAMLGLRFASLMRSMCNGLSHEKRLSDVLCSKLFILLILAANDRQKGGVWLAGPNENDADT